MKTLPRMPLHLLTAILTIAGLTIGSADAQDPPPAAAPAEGTEESVDSLGEKATNPVSDIIQLRMQNAYNWENYNSDGYSNASILQAVVPIKLPWEKLPMLVTRTTVAYVTTPEFDRPVDDRFRGLGDTSILTLAVPKLKAKGHTIGFGPTLVIPTAGDNDFTGSGKWQIGPSFVYLNTKTPKLQWGFLTFQLWDFASGSGGSDRSGVSKLNFQPIITKHFNKGWYISGPDQPQVYDFRTDKWTWSLGPVVGRVFKIGKQPVQVFGAVYNNPEGDNGAQARWTAKFSFGLLL